ncbi:MAG: T9SS type A sorting domain-containing protein [Bacteroidetes bacterium]|nr:T9SS type A sorting domain-containing protein [Bacteroidota bacterium]
MKRSHYLTAIFLLFSIASFSCWNPTFFELIAHSQIIAKVQMTKTGTKTFTGINSLGEEIEYTNIVFSVKVIENLKGEVNFTEFYTSERRAEHMPEGEVIGRFYSSDDGSISCSSYAFDDFNSNKFMTTNEITELVKALKTTCNLWDYNEYLNTLNQVLEHATPISQEFLFDELSRNLSYSYFDEELEYYDRLKLLTDSLSAEKKEKLEMLFRESAYKENFMVNLAQQLNIADFDVVLATHLTDYYCGVETGKIENYSYSYAWSIDAKLQEIAETEKQKIRVAAFVKKRLLLAPEDFYYDNSFDLFAEIYPHANFSSKIEGLKVAEYEQRRDITNALIQDIIAYQPVNDEPELNLNFCGQIVAEIPKLLFTVSPNPTTGPALLNIKDVNPEEMVFIEILSMTGEKIQEFKIQPFASNFDREMSLDVLPPGTYYFTVYNRFSTDTKMIQVN